MTFKTKVVTNTVYQDGSRSGTITVMYNSKEVFTKVWISKEHLTKIIQEIQAVTKVRPVLRLVA